MQQILKSSKCRYLTYFSIQVERIKNEKILGMHFIAVSVDFVVYIYSIVVFQWITTTKDTTKPF